MRERGNERASERMEGGGAENSLTRWRLTEEGGDCNLLQGTPPFQTEGLEGIMRFCHSREKEAFLIFFFHMLFKLRQFSLIGHEKAESDTRPTAVL